MTQKKDLTDGLKGYDKSPDYGVHREPLGCFLGALVGALIFGLWTAFKAGWLS